ncbi:TonB-dependent receptor [Pedobacter sp. SD-b]|uniref:TonB-dependent receptor n=1 Tax=Pedobacter segetis TaxID=2793069 RepID=A0ABS1BJG6_9SPHI|nr:TonB-dependent receptor [Pedobacter segetis]MBK0383030.1 TonB-dependent receptor [Pedobacter segetis]
MNKHLLSLLIVFSSFYLAKAQSAKILGVVRDSTDNIMLTNASINVLQAKDSILVRFTRANTDGKFNIENLKPGDYLLLITYPDYADYIENFSLAENQSKNFGNINLLLKSRLLQEVIFKGEAVQVRVKGDTTEYDAKTFKVQPNAKVEDLLKQLPGIQVDKDGKITAQGQTVTKVLVDGEEFFGDDPTLVTKNIRSDMVDKVQLYDDKSENAKFTGIDDGVKNNTINLKLKEDKKKGLFGKIDGGIGNDGYYTSQGLLNFFNNKKKFSIYNTIGNTTRTGLDFRTAQKAGVGSMNIDISDDGSVSYYFGGGDAFSNQNFYGEGVPKIINSGVHFENKWKEDKHSINVDYRYGRLNNLGFKNDLNQNNLPNKTLTNANNQNFDNLLNQQKINLNYEFKIDTSSNIKLTLGDTYKKNNDFEKTITSGFNDVNNQKINDGSRTFDNQNSNNNLNTSLFYGKKFKKIGRTLTFRFNQSYFKNKSNGILKSTNNFYDANNQLDSLDIINQQKLNNQVGESYKTSLTFTEKLTKYLSVSTNYDFALNNVRSKLNSFNANGAGDYVNLDSVFSNNLKYDVTTHQGGLSFGFKKEKTNLTIGSKVAFSNLKQNNLAINDEFKRNFINFVPSLNYQYSFSKQKAFRFTYNGNTKQPNINQLQPVLNNSNPLYITLGNKDLDIAFTHRFNINYNSYKVLTSKNIYLYGSYSFTNNDIVNNVTTNDKGASVSSYTNLKNGKSTNNFYFGGAIGGKLGKSKTYWDIGFSSNGNTYYNIINNKLNNNHSYFLSPRFSINRYEDKFGFYVSVEPGYNINKSSLQPLQNANGLNINSSGEISYQLPKKVTIALSYNYQFQEKTVAFNNNFDKLIVNSSIYKTFFKNDNLKLEISGNDLLNQNIGFERNASGNYISQTTFNNIQRYFLTTLSWDFSKFGTKK